MGAVTDRALELVEALKARGAKATTDVRQVEMPGFLVVPVPTYAFELLDNAATVTWSVWALVRSPGDLRAAHELEALVATAVTALDVESAEPGSYALPGATDPYPAYQINLTPDDLT